MANSRLHRFLVALVLLFLAEGCTPSGLQEAAKTGNTDRAMELIDKGANVNATDKMGYTPLHWAAYEGQLETVKLLVNKGAKVDAKDDFDSTPLALAADRGFLDVVRFLIDHGANVNTKDKAGWRPLHYAARDGYAEIVKILLDHSADSYASTGDTHQTPQALAREYGRDDVVKLLLTAQIESK